MKVVASPTSSDTYATPGSTMSENGSIISEQWLADGSVVLIVAVGGVATLELQGVSSFMTAATAPDGVYYVWSGGRLANVGGTYCEGVALINTAKNQRFMIEKNEDKNTSYAAAHLAYNGSNITSNSYSQVIKKVGFSYGNYGKDLSLTNYIVESDENAAVYGCLPFPDGSYSSDAGSSRRCSSDPNQWIDGPLSDFEGKSNTSVVAENIDNVFEYEGTDFTPIGVLLSNFNNSTDALSYDDWYVPSLGQLALIFLHVDEVNNYLRVIKGKIFDCSEPGYTLEFDICWDVYASSTEMQAGSNSSLWFSSGYIGTPPLGKMGPMRVRLIRDL